MLQKEETTNINIGYLYQPLQTSSVSKHKKVHRKLEEGQSQSQVKERKSMPNLLDIGNL